MAEINYEELKISNVDEKGKSVLISSSADRPNTFDSYRQTKKSASEVKAMFDAPFLLVKSKFNKFVDTVKSVVEEQYAVLERFKSDADAAIQSCKDTEESLKQAAKNGDFDGDTPQRGVDYWTPEDEAKTKAYIDEQLTDIDTALDRIIAIQEELLGIEKSSKGLSFTAVGDGYAVTGIGSCADTDVIIPSEYEGLPVICIEKDAFYAKTNITSVTIPDSVTTVGAWSFQNCTNLSNVKMGSGVVSIEDEAFQGCSSLTNVSLPRSIQIIASDAFGGCTNLTDIYVPWNEGEIAGAPWGATGATIHYNSEV